MWFVPTFTHHLLVVTQRLLPLFIVTAIPLYLTKALWVEAWRGTRPQAWDGTSHYALAEIYTHSVFPDTFGWTHAFFGGMPSPNFYPPLFYWLVALFHHTQLFSFPTAFKLALALPVILLPAAIWTLAWKVSGKDCFIASATAVALLPLLIDYRFFNMTGLMGLNYSSTFLLGMYSQTLGFVLLIAWYIIYSSAQIQQSWRFALATILLALALLSNFFGATTAALFVLSTVAYDLLRLFKENDSTSRRQCRKMLTAHLLSPLMAGFLTLFWVAPVIGSYDYFVTRPHSVPFDKLVPAVMWVWYVLAFAGTVIWRRRPTASMWPYLVACLTLACGVFFAAAFSPRWFPLHPPRLITTLNFLLAVPVGFAVAAALRRLSDHFSKKPLEQKRKGSHVSSRRAASTNGTMQTHAFSMIALVFLLLIGVVAIINWITPSDYKMAFYQTNDNELIDPVLRFAREHRDGRYLVEVPSFSDVEASLDARAINSYLGAQGNEALSLSFREAAPNVLFFNPLVNAFSTQPDAFGISSVLADDRDFHQQPLARHLERARFAGVRYLVMATQVMKNRLDDEPTITARHDLGEWSVFDIGSNENREQKLTTARSLTYKPALVISDLSFKLRRREEYNFVRFAEEQFNSHWFDVMLARSPEARLDHLDSLEDFGAIIVDTYKYEDEERAFEVLRGYAQDHKLILLASASRLFRRIQSSIAQFPQAEIIDRPTDEAAGEWIESGRPSFNYDTSSVRRVWRDIQSALDQSKVAVKTALQGSALSEKQQHTISITLGSASTPLKESVPVLIPTTYHPNWQRTDGEALYPATPFFMLTFVREPAQLVFARRPLDWAGLIASAVTLLMLCGYVLWCSRSRIAYFVCKKVPARTKSTNPSTVQARRSSSNL